MITKLSYEQKGDTNYEIRCATNCKAEIFLYRDNSKLNSASGATELASSVTLSDAGKYQIACKMGVADTK